MALEEVLVRSQLRLSFTILHAKNGLGILLRTAIEPWPGGRGRELNRQLLNQEEVKKVADDLVVDSGQRKET